VDDPPSSLRPPEEAEIVFWSGPPQDPASVTLPEKLVLALYRNFPNREEIGRYFAEDAWARLGQHCPENACGCVSPQQDVARVMVKQIAYEADLKETAQVATQVVCVKGNGSRDPLSTVTWHLSRQPNNTWRLTDVTPGGEGYLCPQGSCSFVGGGE
jgi:hypothetical protein